MIIFYKKAHEHEPEPVVNVKHQVVFSRSELKMNKNIIYVINI